MYVLWQEIEQYHHRAIGTVIQIHFLSIACQPYWVDILDLACDTVIELCYPFSCLTVKREWKVIIVWPVMGKVTRYDQQCVLVQKRAYQFSCQFKFRFIQQANQYRNQPPVISSPASLNSDSSNRPTSIGISLQSSCSIRCRKGSCSSMECSISWAWG